MPKQPKIYIKICAVGMIVKLGSGVLGSSYETGYNIVPEHEYRLLTEDSAASLRLYLLGLHNITKLYV